MIPRPHRIQQLCEVRVCMIQHVDTAENEHDRSCSFFFKFYFRERQQERTKFIRISGVELVQRWAHRIEFGSIESCRREALRFRLFLASSRRCRAFGRSSTEFIGIELPRSVSRVQLATQLFPFFPELPLHSRLHELLCKPFTCLTSSEAARVRRRALQFPTC